MPSDPIDPTVLAYQVGEIKGDVTTLFDRTRGTSEHGRRLQILERGREEDRREITQEIADLRRTIVQAMVAVFVAAIGVLASLVAVIH